MQLRPIYTEPDNCQDCYKCIRECPVKAIRMEDNKASIIEERCIYCGHCTQVCPTGAKKVRDGLTRAKMTLSQNKKVFLSLAPSYVSEFGHIPAETLVAAIKRLGFTDVSETALGAEIVSDRTEKFLHQAENGVYISSACPVVVEYIRKYSPEHVHNITPIISPMLAHAKILKQLYGEDTKVVFAGPCICKKLEADTFKDLVDVVITFRDLKNWFEQAGINLQHLAQEGTREKFVPYRSGLGSLYPIEGGMLQGLHETPKKVHNMAFSDLSTIKDVLKHLETAACIRNPLIQYCPGFITFRSSWTLQDTVCPFLFYTTKNIFVSPQVILIIYIKSNKKTKIKSQKYVWHLFKYGLFSLPRSMLSPLFSKSSPFSTVWALRTRI